VDLKVILGAVVDYIDLAEVRNIRGARALVNAVMKFQIHKRGELLI
jgi:hypothetical protein